VTNIFGPKFAEKKLFFLTLIFILISNYFISGETLTIKLTLYQFSQVVEYLTMKVTPST
jgi:hypothetical protein